MQYAGVWIRLAATIIDSVILFVVGYVIGLATGQTTATGFNLQGAPAALYSLISFAYGIVLEATQGATLGKMALGLRVVKVDGSPIDWVSSLIRNVLRIVDAIPFFIPYLTGAILVWTSAKRQRLGDRIANTVVVTKNSVG